jgi:hypothetical protein
MSDDLVQRLRDYPSYEECLQAADRIEALEQTMWEMHGEAHEHIKRIEAQDSAIGNFIDCRTKDAERIEALEDEKRELGRKYGVAWALGQTFEAALREIQDYHAVSHCHERARRALEWKP